MSEQWTSDLIGKNHNSGFTQKQLAAEAGLN